MVFRHVDLCSGIGGFALGFEWAELSSPVLFCDIEPWSRKILAKHWPDVPIAEDVKELANDPNGLIPDCDILTAGYPCQPFSLAGERRGTEDDRHIWPYILSIVKAKRPAWCVFENVYGHVSMGLDEVLSDLEGEGYAARPFIVPACAADAPHRRDRVWIVAKDMAHAEGKQHHDRHDDKRNEASAEEGVRGEARASCSNVANASRLHSDGSGEHTQQSERQVPQLGDSRGSDNVAYTASKRQQRSRLHGRPKHQTQDQVGQADRADNSSQGNAQFWLPEPPVGRVANGIPRRVDRLRGLGNAIVPQIAMRIGQTIKAVHDIPAQGYAHNNVNNSNTGENNV
jgi:DNA (cytosine-5)-methyltransferase 1